MMADWFEGRIARIERAAPNVRRFWLALDGAEPFAFRAGQFVTFDLPIHERRLKRWRSYSIASGPGEPLLEFCISRHEGGAGTAWLFDEAKIGSTIRFKGPDGAFVLPEKLDFDLVLIATGTGVAPFRSMLADLSDRRAERRKVHLIFGTRTEEDILYRAEFEKMAAEDPLFEYDVALSRQPDWAGARGHLHQIYLEKYSGSARPNIRFMICGWSSMIDEAVENLFVRLGYGRSQIHYELYG